MEKSGVYFCDLAVPSADDSVSLFSSNWKSSCLSGNNILSSTLFHLLEKVSTSLPLVAWDSECLLLYNRALSYVLLTAELLWQEPFLCPCGEPGEGRKSLGKYLLGSGNFFVG